MVRNQNTRTVAVISAALWLVSATVASADAPKWGAHVDVEGKLGTDRDLGEVDLFMPLAQSDRTLLFSDIRARADDDGSHEGNFGLGLRHMFSSGWNLGAYGYYDRRRTDLDNYFDQVTFGIEALGRDFDFRANAYLPFGARVKDLGSTPGGATFASVVRNAIQVTTLGATIREERALEGFDAEVGWRVPLWSVDDNKALRLYAGMFRFDDGVVEALTGPRLRAELTMYELPFLSDNARLTLGAGYQEDDVRGGQGFAMGRLRIPLQVERSGRRLNWQERRMVDYVVRDVDIVTETHATQAPTIVETATETADGDVITVINSATTPGSALASAVSDAGAGSTVLLAGTFNTTTEVEMQANQTLTGTATVRTASGNTAIIDTGAAINATNTTRGVIVDSGGTLSGLTLTSANSGLAAFTVVIRENASDVTIENNLISVAQSGNNGGIGLAFDIGTSHNMIIRDNTITATGTGSATNMVAIAANIGSLELTVSGNTLSAADGNNSNYILMTAAGGTTIMPGSIGNVRGSGGCSGAVVSGAVHFTDGTTCP